MDQNCLIKTKTLVKQLLCTWTVFEKLQIVACLNASCVVSCACQNVSYTVHLRFHTDFSLPFVLSDTSTIFYER